MVRELLPKRQDTSARRDPTRARVSEGITKRSHVSIACRGCRSRKVRCDNRKPKCTPCLSSNQECHFPISRLVRGMNIENLPLIGQRHQCLLMVFEVLRAAEGNELEELLRQIRGAESVDSFLDSVHEAALLLPLNPRPKTRSNSKRQKSSDETSSKQSENDNPNQEKE